MLEAKTELFQDDLKGIYRCVICECLLMDMADDQINRRTYEDLLVQVDLERLDFDISVTVNPRENTSKKQRLKKKKN